MSTTWAQERDRLRQALGALPDETLELFRRAGASERHEGRVGAALDAAGGSAMPGFSEAVARALAAQSHIDADPGRLAATMGASSAPTEFLDQLRRIRAELVLVRDAPNVRPQWGAQLGKGRALASDGPAWTAALRDAEYRIDLILSWFEPQPGPVARAVADLGRSDPAWLPHAVDWLSRALVRWRDSLEHPDPAAQEIASLIRHASSWETIA